MPGFNIDGGAASDAPSAKAETRRQHRWRFTAGFLSAREYAYLESASRPKGQDEPVVMHHDQEEATFAGKTKWEPIELQFYDVEQPIDISDRIYNWLIGNSNSVKSQFGFGSSVAMNTPAAYKVQVTLEMIDGEGAVTETWQLLNAWPQAWDWQPLNYAESAIAKVSITLKYDRAVKV